MAGMRKTNGVTLKIRFNFDAQPDSNAPGQYYYQCNNFEHPLIIKQKGAEAPFIIRFMYAGITPVPLF
jgi:hypothetical protein